LVAVERSVKRVEVSSGLHLIGGDVGHSAIRVIYRVISKNITRVRSPGDFVDSATFFKNAGILVDRPHCGDLVAIDQAVSEELNVNGAETVDVFNHVVGNPGSVGAIQEYAALRVRDDVAFNNSAIPDSPQHHA